jgi:hypothetical protein
MSCPKTDLVCVPLGTSVINVAAHRSMSSIIRIRIQIERHLLIITLKISEKKPLPVFECNRGRKAEENLMSLMNYKLNRTTVIETSKHQMIEFWLMVVVISIIS